MLDLRQVWAPPASTGISGTPESLINKQFRLLASSLGSRRDVHQTVALSQARWPNPSKDIPYVGAPLFHMLVHLYLTATTAHRSLNRPPESQGFCGAYI